MTEQYVSFETAKLAKQKGFNIITDLAFTKEGEVADYYHESTLLILSNSLVKGDIPRPTQALLQRWLREEGDHDLFIIPYVYSAIEYKFIILNQYAKEIYGENHYSTYEKAMEIGLMETLKLLKDK